MSRTSRAAWPIAALVALAPAAARAGDDLPHPQVRIEARVVETTTDAARDLGVEFGFELGDGFTLPPIDVFSADLPPVDPASEPEGPWIGRLPIVGRAFDSALADQEASGRASLLAKPEVTTGERKPASLQVGGEQAPALSGFELDFVPTVDHRGRVSLKVTIQLPQPTPPSGDGTLGTQVLMPDGGTLVVGGLRQDRADQDGSDVPMLGRLPYVSRLFRGKDTSTQRRNLLIFVTPRILNEDGSPSSGGSARPRTGGPEGTRPQNTVRPRPDPQLNHVPNLPQGPRTPQPTYKKSY